MKNKSLVIIILVSIIAFSTLVFSLYKFAFKDKPTFYADGYVSITDKDAPTKAYFLSGTEYKNGYSDDIIFDNKDNEKTVVSKYSFVFYNNKSINYLTTGVLMPLDDLNEKYVSYYNIKSNYLIEYKDNKYKISTKDKDISFDYFIGRISDNKYLVAGNNLKLKLSSSDKMLENYYYEIEFTEKNIVKINSSDLNIETISSECYILAGDNIKIDLSKKNILYNDEEKVKLEEIVINSDQNIDISYENNQSDDKENNNTTENKPNIKVEDRYQVETVTEYKSAPYVELLSSSANSHKINVDFSVIDDNKLITSTVKTKLLNVKTNEVIDLKEYGNYEKINNYSYDGLASNSKYILTIYASYKGNSGLISDYVMFQRVFNTTDIGVTLENDYKTNNELSYNIKLDDKSTFTSATLNLYDENNNLVDSLKFNNEKSDINYVFKNLNSNKKYTAKIENISFGAVMYPDGSASTITTKTLKYNPFKNSSILPSASVSVNKKDYTVKFKLDNVTDPDKSVKEVTYNIYDKETGNIVKSIKKDNFNEVEFKYENPLEKNKYYYYNAVISLNDNEKTIEYQTENSVDFNIGSKQSPSMNTKNITITATTMSGLLIIYDPDNALDTSKRSYIEYKNSSTGEVATSDIEYIPCENESETTKCANINIDKLSSSTNYIVDLYGYVDLNDEERPAGNTLIDRVQIFTSIANKINTHMESVNLTDEEAFNDIFRLNINFSLPDTTPERIKDNMTSFDIELCEGTKLDNTMIATLHVTEDILGYFEGTKTITLADFGLTLDKLMELHSDGLISKNYVIYIKNGVSGTDYIEFDPMSLAFEINDALLGLTSGQATILVEKIPNNGTINTLKDDTTIGLKITPSLVESISTTYIRKYIKKINYKIYDVTNESDINNISNPLEISDDLVLTETESLPEKTLNFSDYSYLQRGHSYIVTYTLSLRFTDSGEYIIYPFASGSINTPEPVKSSIINVEKEKPTIYIFPWVSDSNYITYKYEIKDIDNALVDNNLYYNVNENDVVSGENVNCTKGNFKSSKFTCSKISLTKNDIYNIYLNVKLINSNDYPTEYVNVLSKTFEGIGDLSSLSYEIIKENNNLKYNNLLVLKLNGDDSVINKISSYNLTITSNNKSFKIENINYNISSSFPQSIGGNVIAYTDANNSSNNKVWNYDSTNDTNLLHLAYISTCEEESLCIYLDYSKLYNSSNFGSYFGDLKNQNITVTLEGLYDSGKIGLYGETNKNYVIKTFDEENKYLVLFNKLQKSDSALGSYYPFKGTIDKGYLIDDNETLKNDYTSNNNHLKGTIYLQNDASKQYTLGGKTYFLISSYFDYKINEYGAVIPVNYKDTSITASELNFDEISTLDNVFTYSKVIPALKMDSLKETINGAKLYMSLSGIKESDLTKEDGKSYLYLEVTNENNSKLIKVNKDELTSQIGIIENSEYKINIPNDGNYLVSLLDVNVDGVSITDYNFDYLNSKITFNNSDYDGKTITLSYYIVLYGLNVNETYNLKAYMMVNNKKTYLTDALSQNYDIYTKTFTTLNYSNVNITNASFSVNSTDDYLLRTLKLDYNLDELIGIKNISYNICSNGYCVENIQSCTNPYYNVLGNNVCVNDNKYNISSIYDITGNDFVFNKNYNVIMSATVDTFDGEKTYQIYNNDLSVRSLLSPKLDVIKSSHYNDEDGYYLDFKLIFTDLDKVITSGNYTAYLARLSSDQSSYIKVDGTTQNLNIYSSNNKIKYTSLQEDTQYYFIVEYDTYINNDGVTPSEHHFDRFLVYTLNNYHISVGKVQYIAENYIDDLSNIQGKSTLRFGYAANIMKDINTEGEDYIPQEAYVAGIAYTIVPESGGGSLIISGSKIFDEESDNEEDKIVYKTGSTSDSEVGDSYYQMILKHAPYLYNDDLSIKNAGYTITYKFYLGGPIASTLDTQDKCESNSPTNEWNEERSECYILGGSTFTRTGVSS